MGEVQKWCRVLRESYWDLRAGRFPDLKRFRVCMTGSVVNVRGVRIRIHRSLSYSLASTLVHQVYEAPERDLIEGKLRNDDVVMELGTGIGYLSTYCAQIVGSHRVFTYEANPKMERLIRDTYRLNEVCPSLRICSVGRDSGTIAFHIHRDFWESSTLPLKQPEEITTVSSVSLGDELARIEPTVLIVDIEGGEYEIFRNFPPNSCRLIMLETHPGLLGKDRTAQVLAWIHEIGFKIDAIAGDSYLFLRE